MDDASLTDEDYSHLIAGFLDHSGRSLVVRSESGWAWSVAHSTGNLVTRSMSVGDTVYTAEVPELFHNVEASSTSLTGLVEAASGHGYIPYRGNAGGKGNPCMVRDIPLKDALERHLAETLPISVRSSISSLIPGIVPSRECLGCEGAGVRTHDCQECSGTRGEHHLGLVADPDDLILETPTEPYTSVEKKDDSEPCSSCGGSGLDIYPCPSCGGSGRQAEYLTVEVRNPVTNDTMTYPLNPAFLLHDELASVRVEVASYEKWSNVSLTLDCSKLISAIRDSLVDGREYMVRIGGNIVEPQEFFNVNGPHYELWIADGGYKFVDRRVHSDAPDKVLSLQQVSCLPFKGRDLLDKFQERLISRLASAWYIPDGVDRSEYLLEQGKRTGLDGYVETVTVEVLPRNTCMYLLDRIVALASTHGYSVGLAYGFIATGQVGPGVYLVSSEGSPLAEVALGYSWLPVLMEALDRIEKIAGE